MADFAAAQARIIERRAASSQALTAANTASDAIRSAQLTSLPPSLRNHVLSLLNFPQTSLFGSRPAYRVGQVDSELLDEALLSLLKKQASEGLKLYGAHLKDDWDAEISLLLRAVLWKLSIWDHGASYGASLQGLKYIDARVREREKEAGKWQRGLYGLVTVGGRYAWQRWEDWLSNSDNGYEEPSRLTRLLGSATTILDSTHNIAAFASFLVFLVNGRYRTITDRVLRMRLVPASNQTNREVSFEYLNRQLVWHAFTEFLLFLLPLVGISRWRRWIARAWKKAKMYVTKLRTGEDEDDDDVKAGELVLPERTCAICYSDQNPAGGNTEQEVVAGGGNSGIIGSAMTDITNPYEADPCGCVYCFVCLAQKIEAEEGEGWVCLRCGAVAKECRPWSGDVVVTRSRPTSGRGRSATSAMRSSGEEGSPQSFRRKSVMFDLDDEEKRAMLEEEREEEAELEALDPMPIEEGEESMAWSKIDADYVDERSEARIKRSMDMRRDLLEDDYAEVEDDGYASRSEDESNR